ncbi:hypothetical protein WMF30_10150 [Sorangium sp. So ce134]
MKNDPHAFHLVALIFGESPVAIADALELYARRIRSGETSPGGSPDALILRQGDRGGCSEDAAVCRMHGVYLAESYEPKPVAMFSDPELARRFANGEPLYDEGNEPGGDLCVMRTDIALSAWNHVDQETDPHAEETP